MTIKIVFSCRSVGDANFKKLAVEGNVIFLNVLPLLETIFFRQTQSFAVDCFPNTSQLLGNSANTASTRMSLMIQNPSPLCPLTGGDCGLTTPVI